MPSRSTSPSLFAESSAKPPSTGWITAHCDGGARGNPGPAGYGAEITDADGNVIAELSEFLGIRTNNYAEYSGLLASLAWALEHGHRRLRVVSDSELMVKQIQGKYKVNSPDLKPLWQEARSRIARLEAFEITHALRHKNKAADALANQAMDRGMDRGPAAIPAPRPATTHPPASPPAASHLRVGSGPAPIPIPYPTKSEASVQPNTTAKPAAMLRGFTRNGVVHILGGASLPDGIFVKIIPE
jgi:ribonuclease HI